MRKLKLEVLLVCTEEGAENFKKGTNWIGGVDIGGCDLECLEEGDDVPESLKLATYNAVFALQYAFAYAISKVLNGKSNSCS